MTWDTGAPTPLQNHDFPSSNGSAADRRFDVRGALDALGLTRETRFYLGTEATRLHIALGGANVDAQGAASNSTHGPFMRPLQLGKDETHISIFDPTGDNATWIEIDR